MPSRILPALSMCKGRTISLINYKPVKLQVKLILVRRNGSDLEKKGGINVHQKEHNSSYIFPEKNRMGSRQDPAATCPLGVQSCFGKAHSEKWQAQIIFRKGRIWPAQPSAGESSEPTGGAHLGLGVSSFSYIVLFTLIRPDKRVAWCFWARGAKFPGRFLVQYFGQSDRQEPQPSPPQDWSAAKILIGRGNFPLISIQSPGQKKLAGWGRNPASSVKGENGI